MRARVLFLMPENRQGNSHKLLPSVLDRIKKKLNAGRSLNGIARKEGISQENIRYAVNIGSFLHA
jgi:hypothetical protein